MSQCGLVYTDSQNQLLSLILERVDAHINILDVSAMVTLRQSFRNPSQHATSRAKYVFPIPARASVCGFEMIGEDGRVITGVAKDAERAKVEYASALDQNKQAALLEMATRDLFVISVGSIPAGHKVETRLTYVQSLMNADNIDEIRLQIPFYIAQRYGAPNPKTVDATAAPGLCRVKITVNIQTSGNLQDVQSPTHPKISISRPHLRRLGRASRRKMTVKYKSNTYLDRDFVLIAHAHGLDSPRCFAEMKYENESRKSCTLALQFVLIPKLDLPPIPREYIFLIDRSGSMRVDPMEAAKKTLFILLRLLPKEGSAFNIISFGSGWDKLWPESQAYNEASVNEADKFIAKIASEGGTEIFSATKAALETLSGNVPTSIFILTDGQVSDDLEKTAVAVTQAVGAAPQESPLRVYTLGIGDEVSTAFCDGVALAGGGEALYATVPESMIPKCVRLLQAARSPTLKDITVDWNVQFPATSPSVVFQHRVPPIQQSPADISNLHAGSRHYIFAIITLPSPAAPKEIALQGTLDDDGTRYSIAVPVRGVELANPTSKFPMIHTLAAAQLIRDLEVPRAIPRYTADPDAQASRKAAIIHLGEKYQLASSFTSFIAIEDRHKPSTRTSRRRPPARSTSAPTSRKVTLKGPGFASSLIVSIADHLAGIVSPSAPSRRPGRLPTGPALPGAWPSPLSTPAPSQSGRPSPSTSVTTIDTMSSLVSSSSSSASEWSKSSMEEDEEEEDPIVRSPSPNVRVAPLVNTDADASTSQPPPPPLNEDITDLMMAQNFDGSFDQGALEVLVGQEIIRDVEEMVEDPRVGATVLAVVYIHKLMAVRQMELCQQLTMKAFEFLKERFQGDEVQLQTLIEQVSAILA